MFSNLNTKRITLRNLPYYENQISYDHSNMAQLEDDLTNYLKDSVEINATTNCKLVTDLIIIINLISDQIQIL